MINIKVTLNTQNETTPTVCNLDINGGGGVKFPIFIMGTNSYIDGYGGYIRTSIEVIKNPYVHNIHIGNYVSIATDTSFCVGSNHNYRSLKMGLDLPEDTSFIFLNKGQILVQNDVWIGHGATIMAGVTIHNGAVVAANSHVVKDVPPYAIVGGNPAKIIKYRFSKDIIKKLQAIKWWDWSNEKISANQNWLNTYKIQDFCEKFYPEAFENKMAVQPPSYIKYLLGKRIYLYFIDVHSEFSLWKQVVNIFYKLHSNSNEVIVFAADKDNLDGMNEVKTFVKNTVPNESHSNFYFVDELEDEKSLMSCADFYIANRDTLTILRSEFADDYGAEILSAVDRCGF